MREHRFEGKWWIPDNSEKECCGTLTFTQAEGANLNLIDSLAGMENLAKPIHYDIILGFTPEGKKVTLYNCFGKTQISSGFQTDSYLANIVYVGAHFQKAEDIKFKSLSIKYSHLDEWAGISGFDIQDILKDGQTTIKYKQPSPLEAITKDGRKIILSTQSILRQQTIDQREASITQETWVRRESPEQSSYTDCFDDMYHIQNFLSLTMMQPVHPLSIEGQTESNVETVSGKSYYPPVSILYKSIDSSIVPKSIPSFNMLFTLKQLDFKTLIPKWFEKRELLQPVCDLYFGTFYNPRMYLQQKFLSLVQALESYHRRVIRNYAWPEEKHNLRKKEILDSAPKKHRKWLNFVLKHSNEPRLSERLGELLYNFSKIADVYIKDKKVFVRRVTDTRNYLIHYDTKLRDKAAKWPELYYINQKLGIIITACLLEQLGITLDNITSTLIEKRRLFNVDSM